MYVRSVEVNNSQRPSDLLRRSLLKHGNSAREYVVYAYDISISLQSPGVSRDDRGIDCPLHLYRKSSLNGRRVELSYFIRFRGSLLLLSLSITLGMNDVRKVPSTYVPLGSPHTYPSSHPQGMYTSCNMSQATAEGSTFTTLLHCHRRDQLDDLY